MAQKVPSNERSRAAEKRVLPLLQEEFKAKGLNLGNPVFIRIFKKSNELEIYVKKGDQYALFKNYKICYYSGGLGTKTKEGDKMAPEGFYRIYSRSMNPASSYHLSFDIGYPNAYDKAHGYTGSAICVHGNCVSIGCFAMKDTPIEEIFTIVSKALDGGQKYVDIHSFPFRMTDKNMDQYKKSQWNTFWKNLKEGYDIFENKKTPPIVNVKDRKYIFIQ